MFIKYLPQIQCSLGNLKLYLDTEIVLHEGAESISFTNCFGDLKLSNDIHTMYYCNKTLVLFFVSRARYKTSDVTECVAGVAEPGV